jgi:hypothetical protein
MDISQFDHLTLERSEIGDGVEDLAGQNPRLM